MTQLPAPIVVSLTRSHYVQLDGFRGVAILLVMIYHFFLNHPDFQTPAAGLLLQLPQAGWMGVDLFFVLSGFLITSILIETRSDPNYLKNFLMRRFLRIWPLYYLSLICLIVLLPLVLSSVPEEVQSMQEKQGWFWLYAANWLFAKEGGFQETSGGYFWSLAVEEQFYLLWPLVVYRLSEKRLLTVSLTMLAVSLALRIVLGHNGLSTNALYVMTFTHLDGLAVGSSLAVCLRSPQLSATVSRIALPAGIAAFLGVLAVRFADGDLFFWSFHTAVYGYTLIAIFFGSLLVYAVQSTPSSYFNRGLSTAFMRQAGKYSYALYLIHVPVTSAMFGVTYKLLDAPASGDFDLRFVVAIALSFGVSWVLSVASWHFFEKHVLKLKRHFSYGAT